MTDVVVIRDPQTIVHAVADEVVVVAAQPGIPGPPGPPGANGIGSLSTDAGNALTQGTDGGLYCPAVIQSTLHW